MLGSFTPTFTAIFHLYHSMMSKLHYWFREGWLWFRKGWSTETINIWCSLHSKSFTTTWFAPIMLPKKLTSHLSFNRGHHHFDSWIARHVSQDWQPIGTANVIRISRVRNPYLEGHTRTNEVDWFQLESLPIVVARPSQETNPTK